MPKVNKSWKLPAPEKSGGEYIWHPIVRVGRTIPFGYKQDPEDRDILLPIPEELELLEQAKHNLKKYSLRDVANWLSDVSGRYISHVGLKTRIESEQKRKREAALQRHLAERYEVALRKAEELEKRRVGARTRAEDSSATEAGED
jgi:hypothetical protein